MLKTFVVSLFVLACFTLDAQKKEPNTISEKQVPKRVLKTFKDRHPEASEVSWYPYPNEFGKDRSVVPAQFPIGWKGDAPSYYEVRFTDQRGRIRKVYGPGGTLLVTSRQLSVDNVPQEVSAQLQEKGYDGWERVSVERVTRRGIEGSFLKVWLRNGGKKRILYFNGSGKLAKTLRFDNDVKLVAKSNARFRQAPIPKDDDRIPARIKAKFAERYKDIRTSEWYVTKQVYNPFVSEDIGSFYDVEVATFYQVLFQTEKGKFLVTYGTGEELIEYAEVVALKELPIGIRNAIKNRYSSFEFEAEHDKVELEGGTVYKVYYVSEDSSNVILLDSNGNLVRP